MAPISTRHVILLAIGVTLAMLVVCWAAGLFDSGPRFMYFNQQF